MLDLDLDHVTKLPPQWWAAIAGAAAAGATIFDGNRVVGGLAAGVAMMLVALKLQPCCAGCAGGGGCGGELGPAPANVGGYTMKTEDGIEADELMSRTGRIEGTASLGGAAMPGGCSL